MGKQCKAFTLNPLSCFYLNLTLARQNFLSLAYPPKGASREECFILQSFMLENADFIGLK